MINYDDLEFKVERWSDGYGRPEAIIALCADVLTARTAFEATVKRRPGAFILLRQKARVIQKSIK